MLQKGQYVDEAMVVYVYGLGGNLGGSARYHEQIYINRGRNFSFYPNVRPTKRMLPID